ncbi:MAG: carbohydrate deacetylase [Desulfomonilia bacterium]|jgi:predicted glycoside hydrolase/deacetylase ChbG (UPF0249 family)|uniref:Carbohydrate deacetylase n=1 Tax=anaerobic digester metagenome TaxID=1263854 RepID=A0A485M1L7_9ZZZZ|nr:ChbG/HpnK family deacetylase [Pseudomonadota bacterium]HON39028.1 ChbG/HpnK family deacetylase [Deltaproteobacteria bacterium]HRS56013.1 ChbG/HpnK family deacetylase [Desulfomonilia bacterium]HPD21349.1 ChbG/HpnK family deacetylase [Deltaproteobacteria bacterium]HPX19661.1 ChbG/HpnK family deacetylase [Deltaproteobacteria bacterium]
MRHPVIVNADDLGLSREINEGIFAGLAQGVISDVSVLIDAPYALDAAERLRDTGFLCVGLHILLDGYLGWSSPGRERFSRVELMDFLQDPAFLARCRGEARRQIEKFLAQGLTISHIDTHHHVHGFYPIFSELMALVKEYRIPAVRYSRTGYTLTTREPIPFDPSLYKRMEERLEGEGVFFCRTMVEGAGRIGEITMFPAELVVHPARGGDPWREHEMQTLFSDEFASTIQRCNIGLVSFQDLVDTDQAPGSGPS